MNEASSALDAPSFAALLTPFALETPVAVAVSGGSDSMALLRLTCEWAGERTVHALIVDHGLRAGSRVDAERACDWAEAAGAIPDILTWIGEKPTTGVQAAARAARYGLLARACEEKSVGALLVGHTQDDQAETLLQRLGRGGGLNGLASMAAEMRVAVGGGAPVRLLRPLLGVSRAALRETLQRFRQDYLDDPSNEDPAYERVRLRAATDAKAALGLSDTALALSARRLGAAAAAQRRAEAALLDRLGGFDDFGSARLSRPGLGAADVYLAQRLVARVIQAASGAAHPPEEQAAARLLADMLTDGFKGATLGGAQIAIEGPYLRVIRETSALLGRAGEAPKSGLAVRPGRAQLWDGRFSVRMSDSAEAKAFEIRALGAQGRAQAREANCALPAPAAVLESLPAVWRGERLVAQPQIGFNSTDCRVETRFLGVERFARVPVLRFPDPEQTAASW